MKIKFTIPCLALVVLMTTANRSQAAFLRDVCRTIHDTPGGRGIGVIWWHPDSIPIKGANVWMGGSCALWRPDGSPLPALGEFARF